MHKLPISSATDDYLIVESFINNYCVIGPTHNIMAIDLINAVNITMGTHFITRGAFPIVMTKYMSSHPNITKKRTTSGICYHGLNLQTPNNTIYDTTKRIIQETFGYTDTQYEYITKHRLLKAIYSGGKLQEQETIIASFDAINSEYNEIMADIKRNIKSINIIAKEYEKARTHDLIQSILQINPKYEPLYTEMGELINPYSPEYLPLIYDRRLNLEQVCNDTLKTIKNYNILVDRLNMLSIPNEKYAMQNTKIPIIDVSIISTINEGSMVKYEYDRKTKEYIDNMENRKYLP